MRLFFLEGIGMSVLDMVNNLANHIWKHSMSQNVVPAAASETLGANVLQKLGLSWVFTHAPGFYINSSQIKILHEPQSFYNLLLKQIEKANKRIVLSSLYVGTGLLEKNLIHKLQTSLREKPNLKVKVLIDCTRGSRGKINSRTMLLPLVKDYKNSCRVSLYQNPYLQSPLISFLPTKYQEIVGLQHIKLYLFDNNFIITGANLSNDYFTNRQDRYMFVQNSKDLTDFLEGLVDKISEFSYYLNENDTLCLENSLNLDPCKTDPKVFNFAASTSIKKYYQSFINRENHNKKNCDTVIFPLLEMGPFNIHADSQVTTKFLEKCDENFKLHLTTGYFNLTESYVNTIINKSSATCKILMAHPTANGFYKANFPAGGIPFAYTYIASKFLKQIQVNKQTHRVMMFEYKRPNWTYHAKGLWCTTYEHELPFVTMIGSPNFGERSVKHDLECQFLVTTVNENLQYDFHEERKALYQFCHMFVDDTGTQPDKKTPYWVKVVVWLFGSYL